MLIVNECLPVNDERMLIPSAHKWGELELIRGAAGWSSGAMASRQKQGVWSHHFVIWTSTVPFGSHWFLVLSNYLDKGWKLDQWCNGKQVDKQLVEPPFPYMDIEASHVIPVL